MPTYEYVCLACERAFEDRRPMASSVAAAVTCPACGSDRTRRRFSVFATGVEHGAGVASGATGGGCACGGVCACGH